MVRSNSVDFKNLITDVSIAVKISRYGRNSTCDDFQNKNLKRNLNFKIARNSNNTI